MRSAALPRHDSSEERAAMTKAKKQTKVASPAPPRKQLSGAAKLKQAGKHAILLGVSPYLHGRLKQAAELELRPVSQFILFHALQAAELILAAHAEEMSP
jgi:hypothetical protein